MNMLYEGLKEKGAMMIVPSSAVESMGGWPARRGCLAATVACCGRTGAFELLG